MQFWLQLAGRPPSQVSPVQQVCSTTSDCAGRLFRSQAPAVQSADASAANVAATFMASQVWRCVPARELYSPAKFTAAAPPAAGCWLAGTQYGPTQNKVSENTTQLEQLMRD